MDPHTALMLHEHRVRRAERSALHRAHLDTRPRGFRARPRDWSVLRRAARVTMAR